ncbi:nuclear valosin-containing protein-like isoform X2 [Leptopilina boulardi]|uniref:nuclear valosin-containing protein-like isoform X2 n=1 Tax=Leptopilina boulardi TaxID=63433 RepID=UPI0021F66804|nr:nuclear valosin-containing protein-like isoform X2 [Leptopilina boulardi]
MNKVTKLNPSIDIIPLQGSSDDSRFKSVNNRRSFNSNSIYGDPMIMDRVQMYLYENEDKVYVDINKMSDSIQKKYREYRNRKRGPFREMVRKAYDAVNESLASRTQWKEDDDVELIYPEKTAERSTDKQERKRQKRNDGSVLYSTVARKRVDVSVADHKVTFANVGGATKVIESITKLLVHMKHPEIFQQLGISPPRGFLLYGPPGCGKTLLAYAIAGELNVPLLKIAGPELVAGVSGESEARIRELFDQALALSPCVLFLDEIDALAPHRANASKEMERRIVSQLLACLDDLGKKENGNRVLIIGATNRPDALDPALRRAGRFDREVALGIPDKESRKQILAVHTAKVKLSPSVDLNRLASLTPGFVGADLVALIREASMVAINRLFAELKNNRTNKDDKITVNVDEDKSMDIEVTEIITEEINLEQDDVKKSDKNDEKEKTKEKDDDDDDDEIITEEPEKEKEMEKENVKEKEKEKEKETENPEIEEVTLEVDSSKNTTTTNDEKTITPTNEKKIPNEETGELSTSEIFLENGDMEMDKPTTPEQRSEIELLNWLHNEPPVSSKNLETLFIEHTDFEAAIKVVQPSSKREGFATVPDITWEDVGSLQDIRQELQMSILAPIKQAKECELLGLSAPSGVLLCGPPGCGKTLLAKAIANEAEINFISVKGPELLNMYVGESEKAVRQCFLRARNSEPCVIFFDEIDALCPKRTEGDNSSTSRVVNQMLTEMDGIEGRKGVFVMAASNRPDIIDPAILRPGRLDKILYVGLPSTSDRVDILRAVTKNGTKPKLAADVNLFQIAQDSRCERYTGADLAALMREAGIQALTEIMTNPSTVPEVCQRHVNIAFTKVMPSVQENDIQRYEKLKSRYAVTLSHMDDTPMDIPVDSLNENSWKPWRPERK